MIPGSARNWIAVNAVQQSNSTKNENKKYDNSTLPKITWPVAVVAMRFCSRPRWRSSVLRSSPDTQSACRPPPDGGYPGANTAEGDNALLEPTPAGSTIPPWVTDALTRTILPAVINVAVGSGALASNITGSFNMAIGTEALTNNNANFNLAIGFRVGFMNTTGNHLTGIGAAALRNNTTAGFNTAIGADAHAGEHYRRRQHGHWCRCAHGYNIVDGSNTAVGRQALENNDSDNNAALGSGALQDNVDGTDDTAVGFQAMQFNVSAFTNAALGTFAAQNNDSSGAGTAVFNTAVGGFALQANVDGTRNTAVGAGAIESGDGGNDNTAVGELAGTNITGNSNTCLGSGTGSNLTGGEGGIYIGAAVQRR